MGDTGASGSGDRGEGDRPTRVARVRGPPPEEQTLGGAGQARTLAVSTWSRPWASATSA